MPPVILTADPFDPTPHHELRQIILLSRRPDQTSHTHRQQRLSDEGVRESWSVC